MGMISISSQTGEFTHISNNFIEYYMSDANGDFVKVYLCLAMYSQNGRQITISDIADKLSCTEKDICRAIRYWIKEDVLSLSYDENEEVSGIMLRNLKKPEVEITSDLKIVDFNLISSSGSRKALDKQEIKQLENSKAVETVKPAAEQEEVQTHAPRKKQPSPDELEAKLGDSELQNLIREAEAYCGRDLGQKELNSLIYIKDQLGFSFDLTEFLLEYCASLKKTSFNYIEKVARNWYEEGITNRSDAEEYTDRYMTLYGRILKTMGITNRFSPAPIEKQFIDKWTREFDFSDAIILEACNRAITLKPNDVTFPYVNGILESWYKNNVHSFADIAALDEKHTSKRKAVAVGGTADPSGSGNIDKLQQLEDFYLNGGKKG